MCRCRLTELNWVSTKIRLRPEWMQFAMGMSISRYVPAIGTAGLLLDFVSGKSRVPRPPPRIRQMVLDMVFPLGCDRRTMVALGRVRRGDGLGPDSGCRTVAHASGTS